MKRKILSLGMILTCLFVFCGCGGNSATSGNNGNNSGINIADIDWSVKEGLIEDERTVVFSYTNNTDYPLLEVEMRFEQKEGLTDEDLAAFDEIKEKAQWTDEDVSKAFLIAQTKKVVDPGETVAISKCDINGFYFLNDIAIYNLMEPSTASISYIDSGKIKTVHYDFKLKQYSQSYDETDAQAWTDNSAFAIMPKCETRVTTVDFENGDTFIATAYGMTKDDFANYVQACKDNGLSNVETENDKYYYGGSDSGYKIMLTYTPKENKMSINLSAPKN